jgi:hypothetical protein
MMGLRHSGLAQGLIAAADCIGIMTAWWACGICTLNALVHWAQRPVASHLSSEVFGGLSMHFCKSESGRTALEDAGVFESRPGMDAVTGMEFWRFMILQLKVAAISEFVSTVPCKGQSYTNFKAFIARGTSAQYHGFLPSRLVHTYLYGDHGAAPSAARLCPARPQPLPDRPGRMGTTRRLRNTRKVVDRYNK